MKIYKEIYNALMNNYPSFPPEVGCIIGSQNGIIMTFIFDNGVKVSANTYTPNTEFLNDTISKWQENEIDFAGLIHSHYKDINLSNSDIESINKIMFNMPQWVDTLYFPIVLPNFKDICCFKAFRQGNTIEITKENIEIIE